MERLSASDEIILLKLVLAFGVEKLAGAVEIGFRHEDLRGMAQVAVVRRGGIRECVSGGDAMFLQHHHEHFGVDDQAGVKQFHAEKFKRKNNSFQAPSGAAYS